MIILFVLQKIKYRNEKKYESCCFKVKPENVSGYANELLKGDYADIQHQLE